MEKSDLYSDLIGKPFAYGGRGPENYDCYGLSLEIYRRLGLDISGVADYSEERPELADRMSEALNRFSDRIPGPEPWAVAAFYVHPRYVTHMGLVLPDCTRFVHVLEHKTVVVSPLSDPFWKKRLAGFYRYAERNNPAGH